MVYTRRMLACLYDVHGNLPALEAVLEDAQARGATRWVLGGDYALLGGWPAETVARLRELENAVWIRGNGERWTGEPDSAPEHLVRDGAIGFVRRELGEELVAAMHEIAALAHDRDALVCHASPPSDVRSFLPEPADDEAELLDGVRHARVIFGHTHLPFRRVSAVGGIELVNPGSVGLPLDGDVRAAYAFVEPHGAVEHRRVEYDVSAAVERLRSIGEPWCDVVAPWLLAARMDGWPAE
jgi:predicted phosphodiesterase